MAFWDDILTGVESAKDQLFHTVYSNRGQPIGYFRTDSELSKGVIIYFPGAVIDPAQDHNPVTWRIKDQLTGQMMNADIWLAKKGIQATWNSKGGVSDFIAATQAGQQPPIPQTAEAFPGEAPGIHGQVSYDILGFNIPSPSNWLVSSTGSLSKITPGTWALLGAFGLLAFAAFSQRRS